MNASMFYGSSKKKVEIALPADDSEDELVLSNDEDELQSNWESDREYELESEDESKDEGENEGENKGEIEDENSEGESAATGIISIR